MSEIKRLIGIANAIVYGNKKHGQISLMKMQDEPPCLVHSLDEMTVVHIKNMVPMYSV